MALNIKINFEERYNVSPVNDLQYSVFDTELKTGKSTRLGIKISSDEHPLMSDVYNLAFGPVNANHQIDDQAKLTHLNHSKVFSTIVFEGLSFLTQNPDKFLGVDGSNTARAYMYYRCIQNNFDYLATYFDIYGVNYYMRMLRDESTDYETKDFLTIPKAIEKGEVIKPAKLYNYFIFKAKQPI
ncbi:MAG: hypothetical protein WDM78_07855 [Puia sp.]